MRNGLLLPSISCSLLFLLSGAIHAEDAASVLARAKAASGGAAWDNARSWHGDGTISAGGLNGEYHVTVDLISGRSVDAYKLGPVDGADGYDGKLAWERDPGGEVAALDTPDAIRRARSQAWLDAHAYWYPHRIPSTLGKVETKEIAGKRYTLLVATPQDGDSVTLWFASDSGELARIVQRQGQDTATTLLDDYRDASGIRQPFHLVTDLTDAAGRTDPRRRIEVRLQRAALNVAIADAEFAMPKMTATAKIDDPSGVTTIPIELANNHIYVDGHIDGKPAHFLVDTGGVNLLTPVAAKKFGIVGEGKLAAGGVGDERKDLAFGHAGEVRVGAATLARPVFYIIDLGALDDVEGVTFDGLVGYEMFRRFGVQIDYAKRQLTLSEPQKFSAPAGATVLPFELNDRIPIIAGTLGGLPMRMSVDTGSRSSLTLNSPFVRGHDLVSQYHAAPASVTGWGVGGPSFEQPARLPTLTLGDLHIDGIAGDLYTGNKGASANPDLSGNLGGGVLRRFTIGFDYTNRKMYLAPNAAFARADDFDRSGLWLLADGDALKVADVAPDSAAARAGMRVNDRIISVGGEPVGKRSVAERRAQLRATAAGTKLALEFQRGGKMRRAELVLVDRIPAKFMP